MRRTILLLALGGLGWAAASACSSPTDGDADSDADTDGDSDTDTDVDGDTDTDTDGDGDTDTDTDTDVDGDTDTDGDAGTDGDADTDGGGEDGGTDAGDGGIECEFGAGFVAHFDRGCAEPGDCAIGRVGADCCGTTMAVGIAATEAARLEAEWDRCAIELPICDCPSGPTQLDDGTTTLEDDLIVVDCESGTCRTSLGERCGDWVCGPGDYCADCWGALACIPEGAVC